MAVCNRATLCKGGREVSRSTFRRHAQYRSDLSPALNEFIASQIARQTTQSTAAAVPGNSRRIHPPRDRTGGETDPLNQLDRAGDPFDLPDQPDVSTAAYIHPNHNADSPFVALEPARSTL